MRIRYGGVPPLREQSQLESRLRADRSLTPIQKSPACLVEAMLAQ